jgi:preprotein translocase YajC subunit
MHLINSASVVVAATTSTTAAKTTSSSSSSAFLFLIVIVVVAYFFLIRPSRNRRLAAMRASKAFDLGDEVIAGGMVGHVVRLGEGDVDIEVADGVVVTFVNGAVQSRTAYEARMAPRGGARGFGARTAPPPAPADAPSPDESMWSDEDDGSSDDDESSGDNGSAGAGGSGVSGSSAAGSGAADWAHGEGGVEPTGGDRS